jgi:PKD repeat protein
MKKYKLVNRPILQIPSININYNNQGYIFGGPPADFNASLPYNYDFGDCAAPPIVYKWNFGDGAEVSVSADNNGSSFITHSYAAPGSYQLTVTASSPGMTDVVAQTPPTTNTNPLPVRILINPAPCNNVGTPVICASGIIQRTSAGQCILANCLSMPSTCSATYFQISSVTGGSTNDIHSVEWETAPLGTNDWTVWQPFPPYDIHGGWQTSYPFHIVHTSSYQMRAKVKFCSYTNTPFYSNILTVKNGD